MILRKRVTGVSFLRDPHYVSYPNFSARHTRSVRRASGFVLVGDSEVIQLGIVRISPGKSASVYRYVRPGLVIRKLNPIRRSRA